MTPLVTSLWITLIGMGLVFIAILLLWGLMEALMRFTARFAADEAFRRPAARAVLPPATGSAWQAVNRASLLNNPPHIARKSRGSVR